MMIIFCSDVHLHLSPKDTPGFSNFLANIPHSTQGLFILGDLFESWWGDDHHYTPYQDWEHILSTLAVPVYFLAGNRDFLCADRFFKRTRIQLLRSGSLIHYGGHHIGLMHGDEAEFLEDLGYQRMRSVVRNPWVQLLFLSLPEWLRKRIAQGARNYSAPPQKLSVDCERWAEIHSSATVFIHGHLHQQKEREGRGRAFYQLGCWDNEQQSALIVQENGTIKWLIIR